MRRMRGKLFAACVVIALLVDVALFLLPGPTSASHASGVRKPGYSGHAHTASTFPGVSLHQGRQTSLAAAAGVYTLKATQIIGTNAHLALLPDPTHPILTFTASTLTGMQLSHPMEGVTLTISSGAQVATTNVAIKTTLKDYLATAPSFTNPADLLILVSGGTVKTLVLKNVTLQVDTYIHLGTMAAPDFHLVVS